MKNVKKLFEEFRLYVIIDYDLLGRRTLAVAKTIIKCGVKVIQLRAKSLTDGEFFRLASELKTLTVAKHVHFIINDRVDICLALDVCGIHLGQTDLPAIVARTIISPPKIMGISTHNVKEAITAEQNAADYIGVGPIYFTQTKVDAGEPVGLQLITEIQKTVNIPIIAIGGINKERVSAVISAGAFGVAIAGAIFQTKDIVRTTKQLLECVES